MAVESWAPISLDTPAEPSLPTRGSECWVGQASRHTVQEPGPAHSATVRFCLSCLTPQGAFRLSVQAKLQVACTTLTPPCPPRQSSGPSPTLDTWTTPQSPRRQGQSLARPPSSNKHPLRFPPHSASLLPLLLPPPATSNLYPTTPNPTYLTWPLSPSHIHQTHHTYEPSPTPNKRLFKVTDSIIIKKTRNHQHTHSTRI